MTVDWRGQSYPVPEVEPPQERSLAALHPWFAKALEHWVEMANVWLSWHGELLASGLPRYEVKIGETKRSRERQVYLYAIGRAIRTSERIKSNTLDSRHRWGVAADLLILDHLNGGLSWDDELFSTIYDAVPPRFFGLTDIRPFELLHLELVEAGLMIARAGDFGLVQT